MQKFCTLDINACGSDCWLEVEACYSRTWKAYHMAPHCHQRAEIMYVLKGKCTIHLFDSHADLQAAADASGERLHKMSAGMFIWIDAGVWHALEVPESSYIVNVEFCIRPGAKSVMSLKRLYEGSETFRWWIDARQRFACAADHDGALYTLV